MMTIPTFRHLFLTGLLGLSLGLGACGGKKDDKKTDAKADTTKKEPEKPKAVGYEAFKEAIGQNAIAGFTFEAAQAQSTSFSWRMTGKEEITEINASASNFGDIGNKKDVDYNTLDEFTAKMKDPKWVDPKAIVSDFTEVKVGDVSVYFCKMVDVPAMGPGGPSSYFKAYAKKGNYMYEAYFNIKDKSVGKDKIVGPIQEVFGKLLAVDPGN